MIPAIVSIIGVSAILICAYVLKRTGSAAWNRKMREAVKKDAEDLESNNTIG